MNPNKAKGSSLIEVLIALVIVALGMLGHALMQIESLQSSQQARYIQAANSAMSDLVNRVNGFDVAAVKNEFDFSNLHDGVTPSKMNCHLSSVTCNRAQFAQDELSQWFEDHSNNLPLMRFEVKYVDFYKRLTFLITWDAELTGEGASNCSSSGHQCQQVALWLK